MNRLIHVLYVEDSERDAELVRARLAEGGIANDVVRVVTRDDYICALEKGSFDLILADYTLPQFSGITALAIAHQKCPGTPFIFVSGTLEEEVANECFQHGATDYVSKDHLEKLIPSVKQALEKTKKQGPVNDEI